jgi:AcrR family transcriptional regulator
MATTDPATRVTRPSADATRRRILTAALELFADHSFDGASTRDIAERAGVSQPSVAYHFRSKDELWRAAVSALFAELTERMAERVHGLRGVDEATRAELLVRDFIAFSAEHPQLHRIITQESKVDGDRMDWLVDQHVRPLYELTTGMFERLVEQGVLPDVPAPFLYYVLTGAGPTIFVLAPECRRLAGFDPLAPDAVEAHADLVVDLLFGRTRSR